MREKRGERERGRLNPRRGGKTEKTSTQPGPSPVPPARLERATPRPAQPPSHHCASPAPTATRSALPIPARRALREASTVAAAIPSAPRPPFDWGVATAAYQVEGAARAGGRSPSIWDTFSNDAAAVGDDFFNRYKEDIELMKAMGVKKFRMSLSWPRVIPGAVGEASAEGLAFYHALIDALLEAGIEPWVTTYHWDLPQSLQVKEEREERRGE